MVKKTLIPSLSQSLFLLLIVHLSTFQLNVERKTNESFCEECGVLKGFFVLPMKDFLHDLQLLKKIDVLYVYIFNQQ